jgi:hypothetical protein
LKADLRPAFYSLPSGSWRDYISLLHLPYTVWHLSYVVLGAAAAPTLHLDRLGGLLLAFFLAVGLGAHALDELRSRPLATRIPDFWLITIGVFSLAGALAIGVVASVAISIWAVPFVLFGGFIAVAYNLEWWRGRFHSDLWFGAAWGGFPALVGYWANAERLDAQAFLIAAACFALSLAQRTLSKDARRLRRNAHQANGRIVFQHGRSEDITLSLLLPAPEMALRLMSFSIALLALGWLVARL